MAVVLNVKLKNFRCHGDFELDCNRPTTLIIGENGSGKTSLLSLLTPFATVGGLDVRNSTNLIIDGKNGYKEIEK